MHGSIDYMSNFSWSLIGPQHLGLRPLGWHQLSEFLTRENAKVYAETELIDNQEAYVIDVTRPGREVPYYARIWIDCERYMPLKIQHFGLNDPSSSNSKPHSEVVGIKLHQLPNGGWFPVEGTRISYPHYIHKRLSHIVVDVNSITIEKEDIPDFLFDIIFPVGASVYNAILGIKQVIGEEKNIGESVQVNRIIDGSIVALNDSATVSEQEPNTGQTITRKDTIPNETIQNKTEDFTSAPDVRPIVGQSFSLVTIALFATVVAFVVTLIALIIRHYKKTSLKSGLK